MKESGSRDDLITITTHRLYELELLPLLDLLDEADVLQRGPGEVSLLHLQSGISLNKTKLSSLG